MTAWWSGAAAMFDLETDSPVPTEARIITACVAMTSPGMGVDVHTWLVKPERDIPQGAIDVHGITTEQAVADGTDRATAVAHIATTLATVAGEGVPLIGHNVKYDLTLLDREMRRLGIGSLDTDRETFATLGQVQVRLDGRHLGAFWVIDTIVLDKMVDTYRPGSRKLVDVAEHYGVPIRGDAHSADADALAAGRIAWAIAKRCDEPADTLAARYAGRRKPDEIVRGFHALRSLTLPELHARQEVAATNQAAGLREYFRTSGTGDPDTVSLDWPIETVGAVADVH